MAKQRTISGNSKGAKQAPSKQGVKIAFTPAQIETLATILSTGDTMRARREYALMRVAVDTMLRSCDILALTFKHVMHDGEVVYELQVQQQKTGGMVVCVLTDPARRALAAYIEPFAPGYWDDEDRRLFPVCTRRYRQLVKRWCAFLHIKPERYSTHSLRRTKLKEIYATTGNLAVCQKLLGHRNLHHTQQYLGVTEGEALDWARKVVFK